MKTLLLTAALLGSAPLQAQESFVRIEPASFDASPTQVVVQLAAGSAGAWLLGMGAWALIEDPGSPDRRVVGDAGYQPNANTAYAVGSWVGSTLAVYAVGKAFDDRSGSLAATAVGTGVVSVLLLFGRNEPYLPLIGLIAAPLQALGGTIGFGL